jgi:hypothetical protein
VVVYIVIRHYFKDFLPGFGPLFSGTCCAGHTGLLHLQHFIVSSLPINQPQWVFILIAGVVVVFPISLGGGLGTRELGLVEGAKFHLDVR